MKAVIVKSSDLGDRFDPEFHIIAQRLAPRIKEIEAAIPVDEAYRRVMALPKTARLPLMAIARGQKPRPDEATLERIVREYPLLSLALIEEESRNAVAALQSGIATSRRAIEAIQGLARPLAHSEPQPGFAYPLADPRRYDDELGQGFDHAALPEGASGSAEGGAAYSINDMWICRRSGDIHPGYSASPVPVRLVDIDLSRPTAIATPLPRPRADAAWR